MKVDLRVLLGFAQTALRSFASRTATNLDDLLLVAVDTVLANPAILDWLQSLVDSHNKAFLAGDVVGVMAAAPPDVLGKIGDGKLLELLKVVLPVILPTILKLLGL